MESKAIDFIAQQLRGDLSTRWWCAKEVIKDTYREAAKKMVEEWHNEEKRIEKSMNNCITKYINK